MPDPTPLIPVQTLLITHPTPLIPDPTPLIPDLIMVGRQISMFQKVLAILLVSIGRDTNIQSLVNSVFGLGVHTFITTIYYYFYLFILFSITHNLFMYQSFYLFI